MNISCSSARPWLMNWLKPGYVVFGMLLAHLLHVARFYLVGWDSIRALPDWDISLSLAFWLGLLLIPVLVGLVFLVRRWPTLLVALLAFTVAEAVSQALGRSFMKLFLDIGLCCTVAGHYLLEGVYPDRVIESAGIRAAALLHAEILGVLRIMVNVCLFVIGTLGISVVSNVVSRYFDGPLGQGTAWCYAVSIFYLALGMLWLLILPLFRAVRHARRRAAESDGN